MFSISEFVAFCFFGVLVPVVIFVITYKEALKYE